MRLPAIFNAQDHYAPHSSATFEGFYSKFRLPSGGSIALIISSVPGAEGRITQTPYDERSKGKYASEASQDDEHERQNVTPGPARGAGSTPTSKGDPPHMVSFTYVNADSTEWFQRELHPPLTSGPYRPDVVKAAGKALAAQISDSDETSDTTMTSEVTTDSSGFTISWPDGSFSWSGPTSDLITWSIRHTDFTFTARTSSARTPWIPSDSSSTPAGALASLPLPIQWHVHSLDSSCSFSLSISPLDGELDVHPSDRAGTGRVHSEKNWALSFPSSYIWVQARDHARNSGICVAGGSLIKGVQAYLIGYHARSGAVHSFAPPTSTSVFGISLGTTTDIRYSADGESKVEIRVNGWYTRLVITARAPPNTFFPLSAPLDTGHRPGYTVQSFDADVRVQKWTRASIWSSWKEGEVDQYDRGSLEFGGDLYKAHAA